jgi:tRNA dimethylallyltransferase
MESPQLPSPDLPPVALIAGPTASGKSALALALAERIGGTLVNADASQVYADLRVVSARPSVQDEARAPHRLFGHVDAAVAHNAAIWAGEAREAIRAIHDAGGTPILVGGTGLYIRTLLDGIAPVPEIAPDIRGEVRGMPVAEAHSALSREDADAAARLRPSDTTRVARALEVVRSTGRTLADWQRDKVGGISHRIHLAPLVLLPDAGWLAERIERRFEAMLDEGGAEVDALMARALDPMLPAMRAIGVPEIAAWRAGRIDRNTARDRATAATRQYAKRQRTWFRHQPPESWMRISQSYDSNYDELDRLFPLNRLTR